MTKTQIIFLIDEAILQIEEYSEKYKIPPQSSLKTEHIKVLKLIKDDLLLKNDVDERLLRGYKDICTSTAVEHEESGFHDSIFEIHKELELMYPKMKKLDLLRMDFGKGNPI